MVSPTFAPPPPLCFVVGSFVYVTMPLSAQSSSSSVARDVLWARVFGALPDDLRTEVHQIRVPTIRHVPQKKTTTVRREAS